MFLQISNVRFTPSGRGINYFRWKYSSRLGTSAFQSPSGRGVNYFCSVTSPPSNRE
jgi:hypothetical protein